MKWSNGSGRAGSRLAAARNGNCSCAIPISPMQIDLDHHKADELEADTRTFIHASRRHARRQRWVGFWIAFGAAIVFGLIAAVAMYAQQQAMVQRGRAEFATQEANRASTRGAAPLTGALH